MIFLDFQQADGAGQLEAPGPGASRIEEQRPAPTAAVALMAVAEDDRIGHTLLYKPLLRRAHLLDGRKLVAHKEGATSDQRQSFCGEAHRRRVIVAAHGDDGRDPFQTPDQFLVAYVASVNDTVHTREQLENLFVQKPVRV